MAAMQLASAVNLPMKTGRRAISQAGSLVSCMYIEPLPCNTLRRQLPLEEVRGAYHLLADDDEAVRRGAAGLVAQLLEGEGAEAVAAAERDAAAQVRGALLR